MPDFVRVTDPVTRAHVTVTRARAERLGLTPHKSEAVDRFGKPLPAKPRTEIAAKKSGVTEDAPSSADTKE